ncbi:patatin-like phospholipase family protein [Corynebacterium glutamicum]|uniref:patatin-like phospholipase family protein n=1 Tax=Corynebacterium glutamicum TaxID=1718 RepID=UPI00117D93FD|nr:patatin-like phospholipase family protein [Corynebacterium glutamicum]QDQ20630.1 patatin family protein [Corynebacterium glutamicum]QDQ24197.1 patatin family protein [Corynebacterium glutamicum]
MPQIPAQNFDDVALIIEGGGTRNSYTAAVIDQLIANNIHFGWVGGVSAGASHTVNYLSADRSRTVSSFVEFAADRRYSGIQPLVRGRGYFNAVDIYETSTQPDQEFPFDFDTFSADPTPFQLSAVRADTGETVFWGREDTPDLSALMKRVRASSTMPGFMPITYIDGNPYVDGAVGETGGLMLQPAIDAGFTRFFVIASRPRDFWRKEIGRPGFIKAALRRFPTIADLTIARPALYNSVKQQILDLEKQGSAYVFFADNMNIQNTEINLKKLRASFDAGMQQTRKDWPEIMSFLNQTR